jgi:putative Holliday junction resolvase
MRGGRRLGVDVGDVRVGVATCDPHGLIATPVETVPAGPTCIPRLVELAREHDVIELVVGLPLSLSGREGPAATKIRAFASELAAAASPVSVRLVDERMSTIAADVQLRDSSRTGKSKRAVIDQVAATVILQSALDAERTRGEAPGERVP